MNATRLATLLGVLLAAGLPACGSSGTPATDATDAVDAVEAANPDVGDLPGDPSVDTAADLAVDAAADPASADAPDATDATADTDAGPLPYLSARKVLSKDDLIGGDNAYGMVGRSYVIENSRVRFLIQDAGTSVHLYIYGGNLIDADVARAPGQPGNDQWREMFAIVGFRVNSSEKVEVVKDGSDGKEAILRVTGTDVNTNMIALLDSLAQPLDITIQNDYILTPDVPWVTLRTTAVNDTDTPLANLAIGDFLSFGGAQHVFTPENGFGDASGDVVAMASEGRGASYGYTVATGTINLPMVDASGTVGLLGGDFAVPAHGQASFDRYLAVGTGDIASVLDAVRAIRGTPVPRLTGTVTDEAGVPLAGARVTALVGTGSARHAVNQAFTGADGTYAMGLDAGTYDLLATAPGRAARAGTATVAAADVATDFAFAAPGYVTLSIGQIDGPDPATAGAIGPIPGKASFVCQDADGTSDPVVEESDNGCARSDDGALSDTNRWCELGSYPMGRGVGAVCTILASAHGREATVPVKPGHYKVVVSRGPEYEQDVFEDVTVTSGQTTTLAAKLYRSVDTAGYLAADFHQHTYGSLDSALSPYDKTVMNLDEGVEIAAETEHDMTRSYDPMIQAIGAGAMLHGLNGDEVSVNTVGHFNMLGWTGRLVNDDGTAGDIYPFAGTKLFSGRTVPELTATVRAIPGVQLWQMNHPRDVGSGYTSFIQFDPTTATALFHDEPMEWGFDMIEVKDYLGTPAQYLASADAGIAKKATYGSGDIPTMRDWFGFLNSGHPICATYNSDSHFRWHEPGYGRNLVRVGDRTPGTVTTDDIAAAVKADRVIVSVGPVVQAFHEGAEPMGPGDLLSPADDGTVTLHLKVQAATWIDVNDLEVYANGRPLVLSEVDGALVQQDADPEAEALTTALPLSDQPASGVVRADVDLVVHPAVDTWYVVAVRGGGNLWPVNGGPPLAYTNAIYVDVGGDGFTGTLQ